MANGVRDFVRRLFSAPPARPGDSYGAPGTGPSLRISVVTTVLLLLAWTLVTEAGLVKPLFLPSPADVIARGVRITTEEFAGGTLFYHLGWSLMRVSIALSLAMVIGIPIGILMGVNRYMRGVFDPPIEFYRPIPPLAYLPLTIIWLGIDEVQKIFLIFLAILAPMVLNARAGVRSVTVEQIHAAYSLGANRTQVIFHVILRGALPEIMTGVRIGIGFGWTTLVAAEMVAAEYGLGHMTLQASEFLVTEAVFIGIIVIGVIAFAFDLLMRYLERRYVPWRGKV